MTMVWPRSRPVERREVTVDVVDGALVMASRRRVFLADDAIRILQRVGTSATGHGADPEIEAIVSSALEHYQQDALVERNHLVDPLLDIRLAITAAG